MNSFINLSLYKAWYINVNSVYSSDSSIHEYKFTFTVKRYNSAAK